MPWLYGVHVRAFSSFALYLLALTYSLSAPSNKVGPETWRSDVNVLFRAESTIVICSQYPEQPEQKSLL